jgi:hypothetical protein
MEEGQLVVGFLAWTMMAFTLGAVVTWRLEGRRPLVQPLWLMIVRHAAFIAMTVFVVILAEPPSGRFVTIDPFWWNAMEVVILGVALGAAALELVQALRHRHAA